MRTPLSLLAVVASVVLSTAGCGGTQEPEQLPPSEPTSVEGQLPEGTVTQQAICPQKWTCNYSRWYSTESACTTACGGQPCTLDYACNGTCVCP